MQTEALHILPELILQAHVRDGLLVAEREAAHVAPARTKTQVLLLHHAVALLRLGLAALRATRTQYCRVDVLRTQAREAPQHRLRVQHVTFVAGCQAYLGVHFEGKAVVGRREPHAKIDVFVVGHRERAQEVQVLDHKRTIVTNFPQRRARELQITRAREQRQTLRIPVIREDPV